MSQDTMLQLLPALVLIGLAFYLIKPALAGKRKRLPSKPHQRRENRDFEIELPDSKFKPDVLKGDKTGQYEIIQRRPRLGAGHSIPHTPTPHPYGGDDLTDQPVEANDPTPHSGGIDDDSDDNSSDSSSDGGAADD